MKPLCSKPLIQGICIDGVTEYRVFATDGMNPYPLLGSIFWNHLRTWENAHFTKNGKFSGRDRGKDIPEHDIASLLSGVIETKENGV